MGLLGIKTFSNFSAILTEDATNTTLTVSAADAVILDTWASHFGSGECRLLVGNFATYDSIFYAFETFLVTSIDTGTGIITVPALSGEANYTTAKASRIWINLVYGGSGEMYGSGGWTETNVNTYKDFSDVKTGSQSHRIKATNNGGDYESAYVVTAGENYYYSYWVKTDVAGYQTYSIIYDNTGTANILVLPAAYTNPTTWKNYSSVFETPASCVSIDIQLFVETSGDVINYDNLILIQIPNSDSGFESADPTSNWTDVSSPTVTADASNQKYGAKCLKITDSDSSNYTYREFTLINGEYYTFKISSKVVAGDTNNIVLSDATSKTLTSTSDSYEEKSYTFKASTTTLRIAFYGAATADIIYIDDLSLMPIRKFDPSTNSAAQSYLGLADQTTMATHTFNIGLTGRGRVQGSYSNIKFKITLDSI